MIRMEIDADKTIGYFKELEARSDDQTPVLRQIGEALMDSTKQRFATSTAPDGTPWRKNSPDTVRRYLEKRNGQKAFSKRHKGFHTKFGATAAGNKKPLIGETRRLSSEIYYQAGPNFVLVGSGLIYSAVQQFGAKKGAFGKTKRGSPIPWGDIPARPYLGLSASDTTLVLDLVGAFLVR